MSFGVMALAVDVAGCLATGMGVLSLSFSAALDGVAGTLRG